MYCNRLASTTQAAATRRRIACTHSPLAHAASRAVSGAAAPMTPLHGHCRPSTARGRATTT